MEYRTLRGTDLVVPRIGFGCNRIGAPMPEARRREVETTLRTAIERGINFFDTADVYSHGSADRLLRIAFAGQRDKVVICSKAGRPIWRRPKLRQRITRTLSRRLTRSRRAAHTTVPVESGATYTPAYITAAIDGSLDRLGTDYLDLFLLHGPHPAVLGRDDLFDCLERLKQQGKIRHYGASLSGSRSSTEDHLPWFERPGLSVLQVLVNPLKSVDMARVVPAARAQGVGLIARQPFHKGAVFEDRRFLDLATANPHYTPAQMALRFGLEQDGADMVLAGVRSLAHLEDNLAALTGPGLSPHEREQLRSLTVVV